ncbi:MAG: phosphatidylglycerol lysyltransferase domain-containing protein [bacterium]
MIPEFPDFKPIELSDMCEYERRRASSPAGICELAFANLYMWQEFDKPELTEINGNICVRTSPVHEAPFFLQPVGGIRLKETIGRCIEHTGRVSRVSAGIVEEVRGNGFALKGLRDHFDYVYRVNDLVELKGRRYDGKRNHIKRFMFSAGAYSCVDLSAEHGDDALKVFGKWSNSKDGCSACMGEGEEHKFRCQRRAVERAFGSFRELGLFGSAMIIGGELVGFMLAAKLAPDTACAHLAYQSGDHPGIAQAMLWETCRGALRDFEYVNLEQDLGISGLRRYKSSYYPVRMEEKYEITLKQPI